jgi:hypothetical protein
MTTKKINSKKLIPTILTLLTISIILISITLLSLTLTSAGIFILDKDDDIRTIDPSKTKEVTLQEGDRILINENLYPSEAGSKFVFDSKGNLVEGTEYTTNEAVDYNINGFEVPLPKNTVVKYEKDKVVVEYPEDAKVEVFEGQGEGEGLIEFKTKGELELPTGSKLQGLETDGTREPATLFFDGKRKLFYANQGKVVAGEKQFEFGKRSNPDSYLFFDEIPKGFDKPAILMRTNEDNNQQIILRGTPTEQSADLTYFDNNKNKLTTQALRSGEVDLTFEPNNIEMVARGNYYLINGEMFERNGIITPFSKLSEENQKTLRDIFNPSQKAVPLHSKTYDENGKERPGNGFYNLGGKDFFVGYGGKDGVFQKKDGSIYVEPENLKTVFNGVTKEQKEKYNSLSNDGKLAAFGRVAKGENLGKVLDSMSISSTTSTSMKKNKLEITNPNYKDYNSIYEDLLAHDKPNRKIYSNSEGGQLTTIHESVHNGNNRAGEAIRKFHREKGDPNWKRYDGFYDLNGEYVALLEPGLYKSEVFNHLPSNMQGELANFYMRNSQVGPPPFMGPNSNYMHDEWRASIIATKGGMELIDNNQWDTTKQSIQDLTDFTMNSIVTASVTRTQKSTYWKSHPEYKEFMRYNLIEAKKTYNQATNGEYKNQFWGFQENTWKSLATAGDSKTTAMRNTVKEILGSEDARRYYGIR